MTAALRAGAATDQGQVRSINQDAFRLVHDRDLFIVADGMGGHQGGEVASQIAVEVIESAYDEHSPVGLLEAVLSANTAIFERGNSDASLRGMGTTAVVAALVPADPRGQAGGPAEAGAADGADAVDDAGGADAGGADAGGADAGGADAGGADAGGGDAPDHLGEDGGHAGTPPDSAAAGDGGPVQLVIANVGDSRAYLHRGGDLIQLTEDHSMVADLVREGRISPEEAEIHPQRNIVTRVLGVYPQIDVDLWPVDPVTGDRYLLCSDGLFNEVGEDQIGAVLRRLDDPGEAAEELVRLANEGGGRDNITVVVVDVVDDGGAARTASGALGAAGLRSQPDLAGFTTAGEPGGTGGTAVVEDPDGIGTGRGARRRARRAGARERSGSRFTWRVALFVALVAAVLGGAFATVVWFGTSTYYVGYEGDDVAIFRGRPGGLLWIDPELREVSPISRDQVPAQFRAALEDGREQPTMADARRYVANIAREAGLDEDGRPTTTTTRAPTTTTTGPDEDEDEDEDAVGDAGEAGARAGGAGGTDLDGPGGG